MMKEFTYEKWIIPQNADARRINFGGGDGRSFASAYRISDRSQMMKLAEDVNNGISYSGFYFCLDCDIDMEGMEWTPIGYCIRPYEKREFSGIFYGGGYAVRNFSVENQGNRSAGLFGYVEYAVIQNLKVMDFIIHNGIDVGGVIGNSETSTITDCYAEGRIESGSANAGGIVGIASNSRVENSASSVLMNVNQGHTAGGLCGLAQSNSRFVNCESRGKVAAKNMAGAGGFVGSIKDCTVENCHAKAGVICLECGNAGGFGGSGRNCTIDLCTASGDVHAGSEEMSSSAGGFIGFTNGVLTRCIASGSVRKDGDYGAAGGFAGDVSRASIYWCYSCGRSVASEGRVGGFAGMAHCNEGSTNIENCYTLNEVSSFNEKMTKAGGFIGEMKRGANANAAITTCYSFGNVSANFNGFTSAQSTGNILDCVWRRDDGGGINQYMTDGRDVPNLSTEQFGDESIFIGMGWNFVDEDNAWYYVNGINPRRPHLNGLPVILAL